MQALLKEDATPFAIHRHRPVAMHWKNEVKANLDKDVAMGVIRGPLVEGPATWCAPMHITGKKNGKPRRTIDFQMLNKASVRQTHPTNYSRCKTFRLCCCCCWYVVAVQRIGECSGANVTAIL